MKDRELVNDRLSKPEILCCLNSVRNSDETSRVRFCKSWSKQKLVTVIYEAFTASSSEKSPVSKIRRRKSPETLLNLTRKTIKGFPKTVLNVIIAENLFPEKLKVWRSQSLFKSETQIQNVGRVVWFSRFKAWISVARENETRLKVSHVEDLIDKQRD